MVGIFRANYSCRAAVFSSDERGGPSDKHVNFFLIPHCHWADMQANSALLIHACGKLYTASNAVTKDRTNNFQTLLKKKSHFSCRNWNRIVTSFHWSIATWIKKKDYPCLARLHYLRRLSSGFKKGEFLTVGAESEKKNRNEGDKKAYIFCFIAYK